MKRILSFVLMLFLVMLTTTSCKKSDIDCDYTEGELTCTTIEEYRLFLKQCIPMPTWFITYEHIAFLGEFCEFEILFYQSDGTAAEYVLTDDGYYQFIFSYHHWYIKEPLIKTETSTKSFSDVMHSANSLKKITAKSHVPDWESIGGRYERNGVCFDYSAKGILYAVSWKYKGTEFTINNLIDYPEGVTDTFVSRLLHPDTVDAAISEFNLRVKGY